MDSVNKIKVSVIIPVYNVEPYIGRCIDSFKSQTMQELEFIFVDDCGTDQSMKIVEEFAATDERVRIIKNKQNLGAGPSRNIGIEMARGEYLSFIDPDDYISSDFYTMLYDTAMKKDFDIAKGGSIVIHEKTGIIEDRAKLNDSIRMGLRNNLPLYTTFVFGHWAAIYRKSLFDDGMVRYGTYRHSQDIVYLFRVSLKAESITLVNDAKYYYVLREGSASSNKTAKRFFEDLGSLEEIVETKAQVLGEDQNAIPYLSNRICSRLNGFCAAGEKYESVTAVEIDFINRLRSILNKVSDIASLSKYLPEVSILMQYSCLIPTGGSVSKTERIRRWTSFFNMYPEAAKDYYHRYSEVICQTLFGRTNPTLNGVNQPGKLPLVWQQLHCLDTKTRRMVLRSLPRSFLSLALKRLGKKR